MSVEVSRGAPPVAAYAPPPASVAALPRRQLFIVFVGLLLTLFLAALDQTIVGTAMPRIIADLHGFDLYSWAFTSYMVSSTAVVPIFGKLSDIYGRKYLFLGGIVVFLAGSALCGVSQSMMQLIVFRALQGVGAGILMSNVFAIVGDIFPPAERAKYQGIFGAVFGLAGVLGPALGGFLTDALTWRWVFYVNLPIGAVSIALLVRYFPHIRPHGPRRPIDWLGIGTLLAWVSPLLLGLSWAGSDLAGSSTQIMVALGMAAVMLTAFIIIEQRAVEPILPLSLFRNGVFSISILTMALTTIGMFGAVVYIPLFLQGVQGASATESGAALLPFTVGMVLASTISGQFLARTGKYRLPALAGLGLMSAGVWWLTTITAQTSRIEIILTLLVAGLGMGTTMPIFVIAIQNSVPQTMIGLVTGVSQFFRQIGGTLGVALTGAWMAARFAPSFRSGLPEQSLASLTPEQLHQLSNPQALVSGEGAAKLSDMLAGSAPPQQVMEALRFALAHSVHEVFIFAAIAVTIAFIACFWLAEVPLRGFKQRNSPAGPHNPADAAPSALAH
ncbi:MAG: MDR family MFS transporter [Chloroflexi bacterium]|nr:MDR family MFS transporter [Chloroflexota bacterium]